MKQIYCDIDSTINDHWRRIRRNANPAWPVGHLDKNAFSEMEVMKDLPQCGAMETLNALQQSFEVSFLTARNWPDARKITKLWLARYGFQYKNLYTVASMEAKVAFLEMNRPDYVIDDFTSGQENSILTFRADIASQIQNMGVKVIVFRNSWQDVIEQLELYERMG